MKIAQVLCFLFILMAFSIFAAEHKIVLLVSENDSSLADIAFKDFTAPPGSQFEYFIQGFSKNPEAVRRAASADVILMKGIVEEFRNFVKDNIDFSKTKVYLLSQGNWLEGTGAVKNRELLSYMKFPHPENYRNLILKTACIEFGASFANPPLSVPDSGIKHPASEHFFSERDEYLRWYRENGRYKEGAPWLGITYFLEAETDFSTLKQLVEMIEVSGMNVLPVYGDDVLTFKNIFRSRDGKPSVDIVLAFTLKFRSGLNKEVMSAISELDVPVINALKLYKQHIKDWRESPAGMNPFSIAFALVAPEASGLIEPSVLMGKTEAEEKNGKKVFTEKVFEDNLTHLISRLKKWARLRHLPNQEKKIAIFIYNHEGGKQNSGASYLNIMKSVKSIASGLKDAGYKTGKIPDADEAALQEMLFKSSRNIGGWAPGELDKFISGGKATLLPIEIYKGWLKEFPENFVKGVDREWGPPEKSSIMTKDGNFVIPAMLEENLVIIPQPMRGWSEDIGKLYHYSQLFPHHQYAAVYLWLRNSFKADAVIHLGRHGTLEWLPGKQCGLTAECSPEALIGDMPNIYPYIVDGIGEGVQAKRRGRAVIITHLTPLIVKAGLSPDMQSLADKINSLKASGPALSKATRDLKNSEIERDVRKLGLYSEKFNENTFDEILDRIEEIKSAEVPYGLHCFGKSPAALDEFAEMISKANPGTDIKNLKKLLEECGSSEMRNLLKALSGHYVPPSESGDPLRNPDVLPTGRNFYGFDPDKNPSAAAFELGKKAAEKLIESKIFKDGSFPRKIAVTLWACETLRNEGVNEGCVLYLMGLEPEWDKSGRVKGIKVIPGSVLKRPRIDVLINTSGLYRDMFQGTLNFLDVAVKKAAQERDIENFIAANSIKIKDALVKKGIPEKSAEKASMARIFSPKPGSYGTGIAKLSGSSGMWEKREAIADVYLDRMSFPSAEKEASSIPSRDVFEENLKDVEYAMHSRSSNLYGVVDINDMFQYLGGLSMAVEKVSGKKIELFIAQQKKVGGLKLENVRKTISMEMAARYLNPKWIKGMMNEGFDGARTISVKAIDNFWGWQVTSPASVTEEQWTEIYETYINDKHNLGLKDFFSASNPWARQSISARLLEAVRKNYWNADNFTKTKLSVEYAESVAENGIACCDHTCNNPFLHKMVMNIISIPGVMAPEMVLKFKSAVENAAGKKLENLVSSRKELLGKISAVPGNEKPAAPLKSSEKQVTGFKMEEMKTSTESPSISSSGIKWGAIVLVLLLIAAFAWGMSKK